MPHAVFHIIFAMLVAEFIREYVIKDKKKFPFHYIFIAGLGGILPDLDIAAYWILYFFGFSLEQVHRTFTHNLFVPLLLLVFGIISWNFRNKELGKHHLKLHNIFLMLALGTFIHLFLDVIVESTIIPFFPFSNFSIGLNIISFLPYPLQWLVEPSLDAGIFILWLFWLEYKHKISSSI